MWHRITGADLLVLKCGRAQIAKVLDPTSRARCQFMRLVLFYETCGVDRQPIVFQSFFYF